ncbi:uncharacterized protein LOC110448433 [Mizuhopecten yessoensis]|uniref:TNFR-Cys domain-containing protein n=1 Tax=Mizuhopecten yessoensis TaxID=6573 RepID=A0A210QTA3_MIZYE|nr:uncharacterized protein LOC110448433 [Mizuhopecten yessoensis]OWF51942.1 hypothetical protein KP79_PYT18482 [Mizuhopecten yessoensis]
MAVETLIVFGLFSLVMGTQQQIPSCKTSQYFEKSLNVCRPCRQCPVNEVIRHPCEKTRDTVCGPFIEFDEFHQAPFINLLPSKNNISQEVFVTNELNIDVNTPNNDPSDVRGQAPITMKNGKWYTLAMALLGVLSFVSLFVIVYIILVCFVCKKRREEKEIIYDPEMCTPAPSPMQTYYPPRNKKATSADVEESDDSSGGGRMIVLPNIYTPFTSQDCEYDADNSGQTVSSGSTNYVYFKAPTSS